MSRKPERPRTRLLAVWAILCPVALGLAGCAKRHSDDRVHIVYWEKWSGAEAAAMDAAAAFIKSSEIIRMIGPYGEELEIHNE